MIGGSRNDNSDESSGFIGRDNSRDIPDSSQLEYWLKRYHEMGECNLNEYNILKKLLPYAGNKKRSGIRVMNGRAGVGKSKILGIIRNVCMRSSYRVIGLTPIHRAASELENARFKEVYTIKSFLFDYRRAYKNNNGINNRVTNNRDDNNRGNSNVRNLNLRRGDIIIIDEASMVGTETYLELFKIIARHKCELILSGDELQLSSIERGGLFGI